MQRECRAEKWWTGNQEAGLPHQASLRTRQCDPEDCSAPLPQFPPKLADGAYHLFPPSDPRGHQTTAFLGLLLGPEQLPWRSPLPPLTPPRPSSHLTKRLSRKQSSLSQECGIDAPGPIQTPQQGLRSNGFIPQGSGAHFQVRVGSGGPGAGRGGVRTLDPGLPPPFGLWWQLAHLAISRALGAPP